MKRGSSLRLIECPIPPTSAVVLGAMVALLLLLGGRVLHRLDDVHVARAAAQVAGDGVADLVLGRLLVAPQQGVAGEHHAGRAETALQAVLLHEPLLDRIELRVLFQPFDGHHLAAVGLHRQHRAALHRLAVEQHGAGAAVAGVAPDVGARHAERFTNEVHQQQAGFDFGRARRAVHGHRDRVRGHGHCPPARRIAAFNARTVWTRAISRLYSTEPRRSAEGFVALAARRPASWSVASSGFLPARNFSASTALMGVGPALVRPMPAFSMVPFAASVTCAAAPAVAKSPTLRSSFTYAPPLRAGGVGMRISVRISLAASAVVNSPLKNWSTGMVRSPLGPRATMLAPRASIVAGWSLAGSPWARLPPAVARLRTIGSAITRAVSSRIGYFERMRSERSSALSFVAAPILRVPPSALV